MKHLVRRRRLFTTATPAELEQSGADGGGEGDDSADHYRRPSVPLAAALLREDPEPVTALSVLLSGFAMLSYAADVASSTALCGWLFGADGEAPWWAWLTGGSLAASLLVVNAFSMRWYLHDAFDPKTRNLVEVSRGHWVMRGMFHAVLLGPLQRYAELFLYGLHSVDRKDPKRNDYQLMFLQEDRDVSLLALVGSFIKSAPLLVLQTYILTQKQGGDISITRAQAVSLISSLVELSLSQSTYHRALRRSHPSKHHMSRGGTAVHFLSHCCVIASRALALAAFAAAYRHWVFTFCVVHWGLMTAWLAFLRTSYCATADGTRRPVEELFFNAVVGVIYVFCFVNVKDEPTRWKYVTYYIIIWIENVVLTLLWYLKEDHRVWFRIPLLSAVIISLAMGLIFLGVYYQFLHPNKLWKKRQLRELRN